MKVIFRNSLTVGDIPRYWANYDVVAECDTVGTEGTRLLKNRYGPCKNIGFCLFVWDEEEIGRVPELVNGPVC